MSLDHFPKTRQEKIMLSGPAGALEALTTMPVEQTIAGVGVICHPDPQQSGTMHNKVVTVIAQAFNQLQLATVRFNYRGVGLSEGKYGNVQGECDDLDAVLDWVRQVLPQQPLWLAGFSFGSYISAQAAQRVPTHKLLSVAPPVHRLSLANLTEIRCPWLVIQGDQDEVVPFADVKQWAEHPPSPLQFVVMPGVGHFFHQRLIELREIIVNHMENNI